MDVWHESQRAPVTVLGFLPRVRAVGRASQCLSTLHRETAGTLIPVTYHRCITLRKAGIRKVGQVNPPGNGGVSSGGAKQGAVGRLWLTFVSAPGRRERNAGPAPVGHLLLLGLLVASSIPNLHWQLVWSNNFKGTSYFSRLVCLPTQLPHHNFLLVVSVWECLPLCSLLPPASSSIWSLPLP